MKKTLFFFSILCIALSCDDEMDSSKISPEQTITYTKKIPALGHFEYIQNSNTSVLTNTFNTFLRNSENFGISETGQLSSIIFKNETFKYSNIEAIYFTDSIASVIEPLLIDTTSNIKINSANSQISYLDNTSLLISSLYDGIIKIEIEDDNGNFIIDNVFNVIGTIDFEGNLFLINKTNDTIDLIEGSFIGETNFDGQLVKDNSTIGQLSKDNITAYTFDGNTLIDVFTLEENNITKRLSLELIKN